MEAICPLHDFVEIQSVSEFTSTVDLLHLLIGDPEAIDVDLEDRRQIPDSEKFLCVLFALGVVRVLVFTCQVFSLEETPECCF